MRKCPKRIDNLILPIFLDDTRDQSIRESFKNYISKICNNFQPLSTNKYKKENDLITLVIIIS